MNKIFWYGSVIAPFASAILVGFASLAIAIYMETTGMPASSSEMWLLPLVIGAGVVMVPSLFWYLIANIGALVRVMTDPDNPNKLLWFAGWVFGNGVMHVIFVYAYVWKADD